MSEYPLADWERELLAEVTDFKREHMGYKAGDKLKVLVGDTNSTGLKVGDVVTVISDTGKDASGWDELYVSDKDGFPAPGFETRGWYVTRENVAPVNDFKIGDEVSINDPFHRGGYTVKGFTDTHVWVESAHEVKEDYSNPYYTVKRSEITPKSAPVPTWEVGKTYEAWEGAEHIVVTAVDEDGNALVKWQYGGRGDWNVSSKKAAQRRDYQEVK